MTIDYNEMLSRLAHEIMDATERLSQDDNGVEDDLPTAADLARKLNYRLEAVKKKLRLLKEAELIQAVTHTPKRYRFNPWALKSLSQDHPFYHLISPAAPENWDD